MQPLPSYFNLIDLHDNACGHGVTGYCPDCAIMEEDTQDKVYKESRRREQISRNRPVSVPEHV